MKLSCRIVVLSLLALSLFASAALAETIMGRVVAFDKAKRIITVVKDANNDKANPDFQLPPVSFELPSDVDRVKAGKRIKLDLKENKLKYFDDASVSFKTIDFTLVEKKEGIEAEDPIVANSSFPAIDKEKKTVSIFSRRQKVLTIISVPDDALNLPVNVYDSGDDLTLTVEGGKLTKIEK